MYPKYVTELFDSLTDTDIESAIKILTCLQSIAYEKMDTDKALRYCDKVQTIENDIHHIK